MQHNLAKKKLATGKPISVIAPGYSSAGLVELLGRMGFDGIFIDCEHGPAGWEEVENMVRAAELVDATPIVRVQSNDPSTITRALDRGAGGVQVPHINTRAQAEAAVRAAKFAPLGHRGYAGGRSALGVKGNFTNHANEETMVVAMLEEVEALKNLDDILKVEHIDAFFIAPGDLSQSMGYPGHLDHPDVQAAVHDAVRRTRDAGRAPGVLTTNAASARRYLDLGALLIYVSLASLLQPGARDFLSEFK
ncbi:MAG: aldolase/citrate lyase family protein [candidate division NC10 bacterium]